MAVSKAPYIGQSVLFRGAPAEDPADTVVMTAATVTKVTGVPTGYQVDLTLLPNGEALQFTQDTPYNDYDTGAANTCFRNREAA